MKIAYYALHYGKEYLAHSIRSVQDAVDEVHVLYTPQPSFGHFTSAKNPDSRDELRAEADRFAKKPVVWHDGNWWAEAVHREAIISIAAKRGANIVVAVDADEVWDTDTLRASLSWVEDHPKPGVSRYRAWFIHFWRSFRHVCRDPAMPERVLDLRVGSGITGSVDYLPREVQQKPVFHFGYAQSEALMRYKWQIHGHQNELRPGWVDKFVGWQPGVDDVHPTNERFWNPEPVDPATAADVERLLGDHPHRGVELIR